MTAPTHHDYAGTSFAISGSQNVTLSGIPADDEIIFAQFAGVSAPTSTGFSEFSGDGYSRVTYTSGFILALFWKRASGEGSATYTWSHSNDWIQMSMWVVQGATTTGTPWEACNPNQENSSNAPTWQTITTTGADRLTYGSGRQSSQGTLTVPSSTTGVYTSTSLGWLWYDEQPSSGASGDRDGSSTATQDLGTFHFAVIPASGPAPNTRRYSLTTLGVG